MAEKWPFLKSKNDDLTVLTYREKLTGNTMTENHHNLYRENLAAYALGTLNENETRQLEEHLESCMECQTELTDYMAVSNGLLAALPPQEPHPGLRKKLEARLPDNRKTSLTSSSWSLPRVSFGQVAIAVTFVLLLALNFYSALQMRHIQRQQAELVQRLDAEQSAIAMLAYPGTQKISFNEGIAGSLLLNAEANSAVLFTWELPELSDDKTYQIWLIDAQGNRVSGGLFTASPEQEYTSIQVIVSSPLKDFVGLGVTIEPWGGSPGPTGLNVLKVNF